MKKLLITGAGSYIGTNVDKWLGQYSEKYKVDTVDMKDDTWKDKDFSKYDVVLHVAGIAHIKETKENKKLYYKINRDLAYETAKKAKSDRVKQFIFLSSMSVYGVGKGVITKNTPLQANSTYGKSKIEAEGLINQLADDFFAVVILRPPMVYGKECKGNYPRLASLVLKTPIFPKIDNKRSMIYIDNLSEFIKQLIDNGNDGLFFPQNSEYVNTSEMVRLIAKVHGKKIIMTKIFNPLLKILNVNTVNKVFGDLMYEKSMSEYKGNYTVFDFKKSILLTEK